MATLWRACGDIQVREWPDSAVVYVPLSGDTHHLTLSAFRILDAVRNAPCTQDALLQHVLLSGSDAVDSASIATVDATLTHLAELGLIEATPH
jgi:PqqD family protein of HPr-rel-A system